MNPKRMVADGYDRIADGLLRRQRSDAPPGAKQRYLEWLTAGLPEGARVLDLGCGPGRQAAWLSGRFRVVGADISIRQLALARRAAPEAGFVLADMSSLQFRPASFDAIAAMYSIIHVPREEHDGLLRDLYSFLRPGGRLFAVLGANDWQGTESDWLGFGTEMYWSHFDADAGRKLVRAAAFTIAQSSIEPDTGIGKGAHLFVLAEKPA
jgi:ubiquinone/menaquinone biosynthesis C-methylase UbiE